MPKYFFILFLFFVIYYSPVFAADLQLTYIGSMATNGKAYSQWWYSGNSPSLKGTSLANSSVDITVDGTKESVSTDNDGNWIFNSALLATGNHSVIIADSQKSISFTLHSGQTMQEGSKISEASTSGKTVQMPVSGGPLFTFIAATLGIATTTSGIYLKILQKARI